MSTLESIEVELPKRRPLKVEALNHRFLKLGFAKLETLKRDSLPVIDANCSVLRRYKTERSEEKYVNEFCEFTYDDDHSSNPSLRPKKYVQPLCIYKKPRVRDFFSHRKRMLPRMSEKKLQDETSSPTMPSEKDHCESGRDSLPGDSCFWIGEGEMVTFYPSKTKTTP